jgi:hypothetical protein
MKDIKVEIIKAHGIDPNKIYLFEIPQQAITREGAEYLGKRLGDMGIKSNGLFIMREGDDPIKIIDMTPKE